MRALACAAPLAAALAALAWAGTAAAQPNPAGIDWQALPGLQIARTETTVGQFSRFAQASNFSSRAERAGGGQVDCDWRHSSATGVRWLLQPACWHASKSAADK